MRIKNQNGECVSTSVTIHGSQKRGSLLTSGSTLRVCMPWVLSGEGWYNHSREINFLLGEDITKSPDSGRKVLLRSPGSATLLTDRWVLGKRPRHGSTSHTWDPLQCCSASRGKAFPDIKWNLLSHNRWSLPSLVSSGTSETCLALLPS